MTRYRMDNATFQHLTTWCDNFFRPEVAGPERDRIITHLETLDTEDAEYSISHGWTHVYDVMDA